MFRASGPVTNVHETSTFVKKLGAVISSAFDVEIYRFIVAKVVRT